MKYRVAYPHPSVDDLRRLCAFTIDSQDTTKEFVPQLRETYPEHTVDLGKAILWRVSRLFVKNSRLHLTDITGY